VLRSASMSVFLEKTTLAASAILLMLASPVSSAEKLEVKIIDRQDRATRYTYVVPAESNSTSKTDIDCSVNSSNVNCSGSTKTTASSVPPRTISYEVQGATLSLRLPDGRVAVVNCESKYSLKGDYVNRRSCRIPPVDIIQVEFSGNKAKLRWSVSLDGKKVESETYKILAVFDKK